MEKLLLTFPILLTALCCGCVSGQRQESSNSVSIAAATSHAERREPGSADNTAKVTGILKNKPVEFLPDVREKLVDSSLRLLVTCGYFGKKTWPDFEKEPHLHFTFPTPRRVTIEELETPLEVQEMVLTLPLTSGIFRVRSGEDGLYLSKFNCTVSDELQKILTEAQ
jgi:hypothetical protein